MKANINNCASRIASGLMVNVYRHLIPIKIALNAVQTKGAIGLLFLQLILVGMLVYLICAK
jgi:hypothetical protein